MDYYVDYDFVIDEEDNMSMWNAPERDEVYLTPSQIIEANEPAAFSNGRKTNKWTKTLDEAFGETGARGREGELFLMRVFESWGWRYEDHESDKELQTSGIDVTFQNPKWANAYTGDCKANMDEYGGFYVYRDWLFETQADRVFHVNPDTKWLCWYPVDLMRKIYDKHLHRMKFYPKTTPQFVTRRKVNV